MRAITEKKKIIYLTQKEMWFLKFLKDRCDFIKPRKGWTYKLINEKEDNGK